MRTLGSPQLSICPKHNMITVTIKRLGDLEVTNNTAPTRGTYREIDGDLRVRIRKELETSDLCASCAFQKNLDPW